MTGVLVLFLCFLANLGLPVEGANPKIQSAVETRIPKLRRWAGDPTVVSAIEKVNAENRSAARIKAIDKQWQSTSGIVDFMRSLMTNRCAERLRALRSAMPEIAEAFVTDRQGANVAMTNKTSDYWQGDEDKFTKAIIGSKNSFHLDPVGFDESIQAYAVQVALPVYSGGRAIGVLVATLNLEMLGEGQ
jgi:hypothetical protein